MKINKCDVKSELERWPTRMGSVSFNPSSTYAYDETVKVPRLHETGLPPTEISMIKTGEGVDPDKRSETLYRIVILMVTLGIRNETILLHLTDKNYYLGQLVLSRRNGNRRSAQQWLWSQVINKAIQVVAKERQGTIDSFDVVEDDLSSPLERMLSMSTTGSSIAMRKQMLADTFIMEKLAILGQWTVLYASPNTGKTLLVLWLLIESIAKNPVIKSHLIFYINADDHYKGGIEKTELAEQYGFNMLIPGMNGFETKSLIMLMKLGESGEASGVVVVLDTLKRFADLMDKKDSSELGHILRMFVAAGGTVICLAHVNKRKDSEGKSIHAGTSDFVDDADCVYTIELVGEVTSLLGESTTRHIEFQNVKQRGDVAITQGFKYTRTVGESYTQLLGSVKRVGKDESETMKATRQIQTEQDKDREIINHIFDAIDDGVVGKMEIVESIFSNSELTRPNIKRVLARWADDSCTEGGLWTSVKHHRGKHEYRRLSDDLF